MKGPSTKISRGPGRVMPPSPPASPPLAVDTIYSRGTTRHDYYIPATQ